MNRRTLVIATSVLAVAAFAGGAAWYRADQASQQAAKAIQHADRLVRFHSPVIGPPAAKVTIVEFFDPSCEACRAFHPYVKQILAAFPKDVRLVIRYTPFHPGSDEAVRILEAARIQGRFEPVLEALLDRQPEWAMHGKPRLDIAWQAAAAAGLDLARARVDGNTDRVTALLAQDVEDVKAVGVRATPTFFVNGQPLAVSGPQQLFDLVAETRKR